MPQSDSRTLRSETLGTMRSVEPATAGSMAMAIFASPAHRKEACAHASLQFNFETSCDAADGRDPVRSLCYFYAHLESATNPMMTHCHPDSVRSRTR